MKLDSSLCVGIATFLAVSLLWSVTGQAQPESKIRLTNVSDKTGIHFVHSDGGTGKRTIVESVVGGLATFDYDGDGYVDIFFVSGTTLTDIPSGSAAVQASAAAQGNAFAEDKSATSGANETRNALYRNNGDFTFTDVTEPSGLEKRAYGMGVVAADYDEDGDTDLYVSNFGQNFFYRNNGDGTFSEVAQLIGVQLPDKVGAGCVFLDIENDGDLDLYVGSYVEFTPDKHVDRFIGKHQFHPGPTDYPPSADALFQNQGDGTFLDISQSSGVASQSTYSMGIIAFDADDDGDSDIWVANDQRANTLWINDGKGLFEDQAVIAGVAFDRMGKANGNMGVEIGDVNGDGLIDLFTTTYQDEMPVLYANLGGGLFMDQTNVFQIENRLKPHVTWGCGLVDLDNDSDLDIYVACGHFMDNIQFIDDRTSVKVQDFVLENRGGTFVDVSSIAGNGLEVIESSRGVAFEDLDNDGDMDVIVLNSNAKHAILRNDQEKEASDRGMNFVLVGTNSNRGAVGAKASIRSGNHRQIRQMTSGRGYQSHYGSRLHAASENPFDTVEIQWTSGNREIFLVSGTEKCIVLVEGTGVLRAN